MVQSTEMTKQISLVNLLKKYTSGWAALSKDYKKVITAGKSLEEIDRKLENLGNPEVILISASKNYRGFIT